MKIIIMKSTLKQFLLLIMLGFLFSGCYTQYNATSAVDNDHDYSASHIEDGWFEVDNTYFYIDYATRHWFSYHGVDLASDKNFLRMAYFRYHHPTSMYFNSPFKTSIFYNYPGYSNSYFLRTHLNRQDFYSSHYPPFYSNPYMYSFYYNKWANWRYWQSNFPNYWEGSNDFSGLNYNPNMITERAENPSNNASVNGRRYGSNQISSRIDTDRSDRLTGTIRNRISPPDVDHVTLNNRQQNLRDRRGVDIGDRYQRHRSVRSPLSSWSSWEQTNRRVAGSVTASSTARSANGANRSAIIRASGNEATVRGSSSARGSANEGTARTSGSSRSGEASSSRRNN